MICILLLSEDPLGGRRRTARVDLSIIIIIITTIIIICSNIFIIIIIICYDYKVCNKCVAGDGVDKRRPRCCHQGTYIIYKYIYIYTYIHTYIYIYTYTHITGSGTKL